MFKPMFVNLVSLGTNPAKLAELGTPRISEVLIILCTKVDGHPNIIWLVVWNIWIIFPYIGNSNPNWLSYFFRGVGIPPTSHSLVHFFPGNQLVPLFAAGKPQEDVENQHEFPWFHYKITNHLDDKIGAITSECKHAIFCALSWLSFAIDLSNRNEW